MGSSSAFIYVYGIFSDLLSRVLFSFLPALLATSLLSPSLGTFLHLFAPRKMLYPVEQGSQQRAWRGAVSGWASPQSSGRKFLPEICVN